MMRCDYFLILVITSFSVWEKMNKGGRLFLSACCIRLCSSFPCHTEKFPRPLAEGWRFKHAKSSFHTYFLVRWINLEIFDGNRCLILISARFIIEMPAILDNLYWNSFLTDFHGPCCLYAVTYAGSDHKHYKKNNCTASI